MSWNPGSGPLTSDAVSSMAIEASTMKLLHEFLFGYFDGANHTVDGETVEFIAATLLFQQAKPPQPLNGFAINLILAEPGKVRTYWRDEPPTNDAPREKEAYIDIVVTAMLMANVKSARGDGENSKGLIQTGADQLTGLLLHKLLTKPLSQKGIHRIATVAPGKLIGSEDFYCRSVKIKAMLQFRIGGD